MPAMNRSPNPSHAARAASGLLVLVAAGFGINAYAGLGEGADSVARDHAALRGQAETRAAMVNYDRHEITTDTGTRVREYVSKAGKVFAVSWSGPSLPDLKTLLGAQYDAYVAAAQEPHHNHHVFTISTPDLVLQNSRLPRGFLGRAHIPSLVPAGTSIAELD